MQAQAGFAEPAVEASDFAILKTWHVSGATGVAAVGHFTLSGEQGVDTQARGNWRSDEAVGGGDDQQLVAGFAVLGEQGFAFGENDRLNAIMHKFAVPLLKLRHFRAAEDFQAEIQVVGDVQAAGQVILVELIIARLVGNPVEDAALTQIIAPGVIAVAAE